MSESERDAIMKKCLSYDAVLRKDGHVIGGEALQSARKAEQLGGILVLEANVMNHAIQLMSKHAGVRLGGGFEIRPIEDIGLPDSLSEQYAQSGSRKKPL
jgi:hypothetical protein